MRPAAIAPAAALAAALAAVAALAAGSASAEQLSVVGSWSGLPLHKEYEAPYWTTTLPKATDGKISVQMTTHDQMGIKGGDVFRLLSQHVFDVGMTVADYAADDAPGLEGLDVPLIAQTVSHERKMFDDYRPEVEDIFRKKFNAKVLAIAPYPPQIVFCKGKVAGLADLKGKRVRGSGRMTLKLLQALGAEPVNVSFGEVPGALQRGTIDCAVTGAGSGYSAGWWQVTQSLLALPIGGWDPVVTAINLDAWKGLSAYFGLNQVVEGRRSGLTFVEVTNAQHLDTLNGVPGFDALFVPLHHYFVQALDMMYAHLRFGTPLPPSQVVHTVPRAVVNGVVAPISVVANLPAIAPSPDAAAAITFEGSRVHISD